MQQRKQRVGSTGLQALITADVGRRAQAPEVMQGRPPKPSSDIYSFGVILWQLITGGNPVTDRRRDVKCAAVRPWPHACIYMRLNQRQCLAAATFSSHDSKLWTAQCRSSRWKGFPGGRTFHCCALCRLSSQSVSQSSGRSAHLKGGGVRGRVGEQCPQAIADLMLQCLDSVPQARPSAAEIVGLLTCSSHHLPPALRPKEGSHPPVGHPVRPPGPTCKAASCVILFTLTWILPSDEVPLSTAATITARNRCICACNRQHRKNMGASGRWRVSSCRSPRLSNEGRPLEAYICQGASV